MTNPANDTVSLQIEAAFAPYVPVARLLAVIAAALQAEHAVGKELSLVISDDTLLQQLNHAYRGINAPTDVLSFAAQDDAGANGQSFVTARERNYLGDVVISFPTAQHQAEAAGQSVEAELCLLAVHGVLHLLGYDHADEAEEADMWARQARILEAVPA
ncbi:MAG: rRNA maturation RNase YbeY [Caldilineales bacterium]